MEERIVTSQAELDAIPVDFNGRIIIKFGTPYNRAVVNRRFMRSVVAWGNSSVEAWGNSSVEARGNSSVVARGNSSVVARGNSSVEARGNSSVEGAGNAQIVDATYSHKVKTSGNARIVYNPKTAQEYVDFYGLENDGKTVKLYKAVHNRNGVYESDNNSAFKYAIGEEAVADRLDTDPSEDCGHGIHAAHMAWCIDYGRDWKDLAILEVEMEMDGLIVPVNGSGKVRAAKCKVIREVPLEECGLYGKILSKRNK